MVGNDDDAAFSGNGTLKIAILNIMPIKEVTEADLVRVLSYSPLPIDITWIRLRSHISKNTSCEHLDMFYRYFDEVEPERFDGLIVTGAPVEDIHFEEVGYWQELGRIFKWSLTNVRSTLHVCWAAQAGLYYHYGINKHRIPNKMFGIFEQHVLCPKHPLFRGFDDVFRMPHSRHTEIRKDDILACPELSLVVEGPVSGVSVVTAMQGRQVFITGHLEYAQYTLDTEYHRDMGKRDDVNMPVNYYKDDNICNPPIVTWRAHGTLFYTNWVKVLRNFEF